MRFGLFQNHKTFEPVKPFLCYSQMGCIELRPVIFFISQPIQERHVVVRFVEIDWKAAAPIPCKILVHPKLRLIPVDWFVKINKEVRYKSLVGISKTCEQINILFREILLVHRGKEIELIGQETDTWSSIQKIFHLRRIVVPESDDFRRIAFAIGFPGIPVLIRVPWFEVRSKEMNHRLAGDGQMKSQVVG